MRFFCAIIIIGLLGLLPVQGHAQEQEKLPTPNQTLSKKLTPLDLFEQLPLAVQNEILAETQDVYKSCAERKNYSTYHDCQCLSVRFFDKRVIDGPEQPRSSLTFALGKLCVNSAGIAGAAYKDCLDMLEYESGDLQKKCTCYANGLAQSYTEKPSPNYSYIQQLSSRALISCNKKARQGGL